MGKHDFDSVIDRRGTDSLKYDFAVQRGKPADILPMWVADMDFSAPPCVTEALAQKSRHGIFGYSDTGKEYFDTLHSWFGRRFNWEIRSEWLVKTPGIVPAIHMAIRALTAKGDGVLIQPPVYYPFASAVRDTGRKLVVSSLVLESGKYHIDFEDFEAKIRGEEVKLFILCSPHNPVGRVWTTSELKRLGDICLRHGVIVVSDEIHADFVYPGHRHRVFASLSPELQEITIICTSPSKTFNLAGLQLSNIFIPNSEIRRAFLEEYTRCGLSQPSLMGIVACQAAYSGGEEWLEELLDYLEGNFSFLRDYLAEFIPDISLIEPEGTYLAWLDFRKLGLNRRQLDDILVHRAGLWLDGGAMFGEGGEGFQRMNIACPRSILMQAMEYLRRAFKQ